MRSEGFISSNKKKRRILFSFLLLSFFVLFFLPFIGGEKMEFLPFSSFFGKDLDSKLFWHLRVPRILFAFLVGATLSVGGMNFQALFRNSLATPFTLGVSSGAAFGVALYVYFNMNFHFVGISGMMILSFLGAISSIFIVYGFSRSRQQAEISTQTMLLAGVMVNFFYSSIILLIQYLSDSIQSFKMVRLMMGGLEVVGLQFLKTMLPYVFFGCFLIFLFYRELNLISISDEVALSKGVELKKVKTILFFATSLMIAGVVSACGPIGFVGMMVPHMSRLIIGSEHKYLILLSFLLGGIFLSVCDTVARLVIYPVEIPVGVITALMGGPFFLWLLLKRKNF